MLVVSNIDLTAENIQVMKPTTFLETTVKDFTLNLNDDYRYLKMGYYVSLHAEVLGSKVIPSCEDIIDCSRAPILLLRAAKAGIPTLPFLVTDSVKKIMGEIGFPVVVFAVNPFIHSGYKTAANKSALYRVMKSLGMNYKFAVCAQPLKGDMISVKAIFGKSEGEKEAQKISEQVFELFKIPVCKLHLQKVEDKTYLCGMQPLSREELCRDDLEAISRGVSLISERGEPFSD